MLRYLGIYAVAFVVAIGLATYLSKHHPGAAPVAAGAIHAALATTTPTIVLATPTQTIEGDPSGHYVTRVEVDGRDVPMLIDTGASFLSLTTEDASSLGIHPAASEFTVRMQTANGISAAARTWLPHVKVGSVEVHDVEAIVMAPGASQTSLLGMSFLSKLHRFGVAGGRLRLEQ